MNSRTWSKRSFRKIFFMIGLATLFLLAPSLKAAESFNAPVIVVYDLDSDTYIYQKNAQTKRAPASTIKVLTALTAVALEKDLDRYVAISRHAANMEPSKAYLKAGESYRLSDLLHAVLMGSCNDAAAAVAEAVSGSEKDFAKEMNTMAKKLGAYSTFATNASGLPEPKGMVTTAADCLLFLKALRAEPRLKAIMKKSSYQLKSQDGREISIDNHNRLLREDFKYPVLGKTGYTRSAQHCFIALSEHKSRAIAVVVLGDKKAYIWKDIRKAFSHGFNTSAYLPRYMKDQSLSVEELHKALKKKGYSLAEKENSYGSQTREAVKIFQKAKGLEADGIAGKNTWEALNE